MKIIGSHDCGIVEDNLRCLLKIEKGILGVYEYGKTNFNDLNHPKNEKQWNFRKVNWKESKPAKLTKMSSVGMEWVWKYSHVIEYLTEENKTQRVFINPSAAQKNYIKWTKKQFLIQKLTLIEFLMGTIIAFAINILSSMTYDYFKNKNATASNIAQETSAPIEQPRMTSGTNLANKKTNISKSSTMSDTIDLKRHQGDSLIHGIKY